MKIKLPEGCSVNSNVYIAPSGRAYTLFKHIYTEIPDNLKEDCEFFKKKFPEQFKTEAKATTKKAAKKSKKSKK